MLLTRITRRAKAILSGGLHPHYVSVANTMAKYTGDQLVTALPELTAEPDTDKLIGMIDDETSCVVVQYPDILGRISDLSDLAAACQAKKASVFSPAGMATMERYAAAKPRSALAACSMSRGSSDRLAISTTSRSRISAPTSSL